MTQYNKQFNRLSFKLVYYEPGSKWQDHQSDVFAQFIGQQKYR